MPERVIIVSACLLGVNCRLDGRATPRSDVKALGRDCRLVPVCPEQLGGLPTPREPAEIQGGTGEEVLDGTASVRTQHGEDVTAQFRRGAEEVARIARLVGARSAVLKARSPSCGRGLTYDGSFSRRLRPGHGVCAARLLREGVEVRTEEELGNWPPAGEEG